MRGENWSSRVLAKGKEVFIGVNVHKESWNVSVRGEGEEVFHGRIPSQYHALRKLLDRFKDCKIKVAYEAGPCGFWLHDKLTREGFEVIVVLPSLIPIESGNKVKTDKRDSRKQALREPDAEEGICSYRGGSGGSGACEDPASGLRASERCG